MATNVPVLRGESSLSRYLEEISAFPVLEAKEELELAYRWRDHEDRAAAHQLVTSHLRLVAKIAFGYRGYGLPVSDLIAEGNIGMMQAVKRFDPDKGFRLSTYAMWWIKASIQEYILKSWSLVKIGTSSAQKKLFFNLRRIKNKLNGFAEGSLSPENVEKVAHDLGVSERDVMDMEMRLGGSDQTLNAPVGGEEGGIEFIDLLASNEESVEDAMVERDERDSRHALLEMVMETLNAREKDILTRRRLQEPPATLEELSQEYAISRERVRQIEARVMEKLTKAAIEQQAKLALPAPEMA